MSHYGLSRFINDMDFFVEKYPDDQHQLVQAGCSSLRKLMSNPDFLNPDFVTAVTHGEDEGRVYTSPEHGYYIQFFACQFFFLAIRFRCLWVRCKEGACAVILNPIRAKSIDGTRRNSSRKLGGGKFS